jgi:Mn2+/Fe2+ NRAMP family transporter
MITMSTSWHTYNLPSEIFMGNETSRALADFKLSPRLKQAVRTLGVLGPAVLISVELFDPASIVTATAAGAAFGFSVLWAAFYSGILLVIVQEISARLGVVTGKTLAENIHHTYGKPIPCSFFSPRFSWTFQL